MSCKQGSMTVCGFNSTFLFTSKQPHYSFIATILINYNSIGNCIAGPQAFLPVFASVTYLCERFCWQMTQITMDRNPGFISADICILLECGHIDILLVT